MDWYEVFMGWGIDFTDLEQFANYSLQYSTMTTAQRKVGLCWGLTSQSTIFQSCRDGAIASWVINQYFRGVKCLAQGHKTAEVGLEPRTSRSGVRHSTTEPPRSPTKKSIFHKMVHGQDTIYLRRETRSLQCKSDYGHTRNSPYLSENPREGSVTNETKVKVWIGHIA